MGWVECKFIISMQTRTHTIICIWNRVVFFFLFVSLIDIKTRIK